MVTCWERADLLALVGDVNCIFVTFPSGILGQVWYLIVSFPDLCHLSYFVQSAWWQLCRPRLEKTCPCGINHTKTSQVRVPTNSGNHGTPGKLRKKKPRMEKSSNLNNHGKIMEFLKII